MMSLYRNLILIYLKKAFSFFTVLSARQFFSWVLILSIILPARISQTLISLVTYRKFLGYLCKCL